MTLTLKGLLGVFFFSIFFSANSSAQIISTIAGNGTAGNSGDGGQAVSANINAVDVAVDLAGNLYISGGNSIRKVTPAGVITTICGGTTGTGGDGGPATSAQMTAARGIAVDAYGNIYM